MLSGRNTPQAYATRCALLVLAVAVTGCDKAQLLAPTGSTLTLSSATRTLPIGGSTEVSAAVLESSGTPVHDGTTVRFTTTLGSVTPVEAQTRNGIATATFNAGNASGTAEVRATSGGAGGASTGTGTTTTSTNVIQITIGAANASRVTLSANPTVVPSSGGTSEITAGVFDAAGNPLANVPVFFSTDAGTVSASPVTTDSAGRASVTLTTTRKATVTASVGGTASGTGTTDQRTATIVVDVNVSSGASLRCQGSGTAATLGCTQSAGSPVTFTIDRSSATGASAITGASLDFGDGTSVNLGPITSTTNVTHIYQSNGSYTATLRATDTIGETTTATNTVTIIPRTPLSVALTATPGTSVPGIGNTTSFTATVTPTTELVESYTWDFGDGTTITTSSNTTTHVYTSNGLKVATVTVRTVEGRTASSRTEFIISGI